MAGKEFYVFVQVCSVQTARNCGNPSAGRVLERIKEIKETNDHLFHKGESSCLPPGLPEDKDTRIHVAGANLNLDCTLQVALLRENGYNADFFRRSN